MGGRLIHNLFYFTFIRGRRRAVMAAVVGLCWLDEAHRSSPLFGVSSSICQWIHLNILHSDNNPLDVHSENISWDSFCFFPFCFVFIPSGHLKTPFLFPGPFYGSSWSPGEYRWAVFTSRQSFISDWDPTGSNTDFNHYLWHVCSVRILAISPIPRYHRVWKKKGAKII